MQDKPDLLIATLPHNLSGPQLYVAQLMANAKLHAAFNPEVWAVEDLYRGYLGKWRLLQACKAKIAGRKNIVVYINQDLSLVTWLSLCFRLSGIRKIAVHSHASSFCAPNNALTRKIYQLILNACTATAIAVSQGAADAMFGNRAAKRCTLIPALIDFNVLAKQSDSARQRITEDFTFACIGRMSPEKNQKLAISAFAQLIKQNQRAHLLLIGDGDLAYECDLIEFAKSLCVEKYVTIQRASVNIAAIYRNQIDAVLVPSLFEGQNRVVAEAQFFGLPVATSIGVPDIAFLDKRNAYSEIPLELNSWRKVMTAMLNGKPARLSMQIDAARHSPLSIENGIEILVDTLNNANSN